MNYTFISLVTFFFYFSILWIVSHFANRNSLGNSSFFHADRRSPWVLVAFGMIGASVSGVSLVSVPGYVDRAQMTYLQMCLGFIPGYLFVAFVLLPIYYRLGLTSIYSFIEQRLGFTEGKCCALLFLISKFAGASIKFFLTCLVVQQLICNNFNIPFELTACTMILMVWCYSKGAGIKTLVYTDALQTLCFILAIIVILFSVKNSMFNSFSLMNQELWKSPMSQIFVMKDWNSSQYFWKQFFSGAFIVIVMTGLDQDMMQKNLTCSSLKNAQKNMCSYGVCFVPVNMLLLILGILLYTYVTFHGIEAPRGDELLPYLIGRGYFGYEVLILFTLGITAAAFSSIDSSITAITTTVCIDLLHMKTESSSKQDVKQRNRVHLIIALVFIALVILFKYVATGSVIDIVYQLASYTYGPLLGIFAFALIYKKRKCNSKIVPYVMILSPILTYVISIVIPILTNYRFGYEILIINGALTYLGLHLCSKQQN